MTFLTNYSISQNSLSNNNSIWKTQGNAADTNAFMGTTNTTGLRFKTDNIERMWIGEDGYVGMGVEKPWSSLGGLCTWGYDIIDNENKQRREQPKPIR